jgi:hypothetical protein
MGMSSPPLRAVPYGHGSRFLLIENRSQDNTRPRVPNELEIYKPLSFNRFMCPAMPQETQPPLYRSPPSIESLGEDEIS